jgi:methylated-DNA-protein-cysteine methyltransferase-like protein
MPVPEGSEFTQLIYGYVSRIPSGRVMTYGQLAALCGSPRAARIVGGIAHFGPEELPWHRVVNKQGGLAAAFPGGRTEQARRLEEEGVELDENLRVDVGALLWWPQQ